MSTIHKPKPSSFSKGLFAASTPEMKGATLPLFSLPFCSWNSPQTEKLEGLVNPTNPYKRPTLLGPSPGVPSLHTLFKWIMSKLVLIEGKRVGKSWLLRETSAWTHVILAFLHNLVSPWHKTYNWNPTTGPMQDQRAWSDWSALFAPGTLLPWMNPSPTDASNISTCFTHVANDKVAWM